MSEFYLVAKIISVWGKKGFVRISSFSDFPERFLKLKKVYIDFFGEKKEFSVEKIDFFKNSYNLKFANFNSDEDVEILIGKDVFVDESDLIQLPEDTYFVHDLIGSKVVYRDKEIGIIKDIFNYPANDVYSVVNNENKEILIPAIKDAIESFDNENKILKIKSEFELFDEDEI